MASMKIVQFSRNSTPLSIYVQNSSNPLTLDVQFQTNLPSPNDNHQLKENIFKDQYYMLLGPSFRSVFVFSINSLMLSGFLLTCFHSAKVSLSAFFVVLHSCVCSCPIISPNAFYL